jgi:hypothetical protein
MSLENSIVRINSYTAVGLPLGPTIVGTFSSSSGFGCYFDYYVVDTVTNGKRVGTIMAVWDSGVTSFTDYSSPDLIGSTVDFKWKVISTTTEVILEANVGANTWNAKVSVRIIS